MKLLKRKGWKEQIGFEKQCPSYERVVFGLKLRIWWGGDNYDKYIGIINKGPSEDMAFITTHPITSTDPLSLARRLETRAGQMLRSEGFKLLLQSRR